LRYTTQLAFAMMVALDVEKRSPGKRASRKRIDAHQPLRRDVTETVSVGG